MREPKEGEGEEGKRWPARRRASPALLQYRRAVLERRQASSRRERMRARDPVAQRRRAMLVALVPLRASDRCQTCKPGISSRRRPRAGDRRARQRPVLCRWRSPLRVAAASATEPPPQPNQPGSVTSLPHLLNHHLPATCSLRPLAPLRSPRWLHRKTAPPRRATGSSSTQAARRASPCGSSSSTTRDQQPRPAHQDIRSSRPGLHRPLASLSLRRI